MYPLRLRNQQQNDRTFFKPLYSYRHTVTLPREFATKHGHQLQSTALLKDPVGNLIKVEVHSHRKRLWFSSISKLRNAYDFEGTALVKYTYAGNGNFNIQLFDKDQKEVHYPPKLNDAELGFEFEDLQIGRHSNMPHFYVDYDNIRIWNDLVISGKPGKLFWISVFATEAIKGIENPIIPSKVTKVLFAHKPTEIDVLLPDGSWTKWQLIWNKYIPTKAIFGYGWKEFHKKEFDNTCLHGGEHHMSMWKRDDHNTYGVHIDHWVSKRANSQQQS